ncbi:NF-kappa-B inhibitor beta [Crotalus adamanteus]|uniref:NF-kappa-B inhibitor beta n=1 Tax=Crotalus adamanteus TaxID=8729 RepID=A0AAW1AXS8_CROAD
MMGLEVNPHSPLQIIFLRVLLLQLEPLSQQAPPVGFLPGRPRSRKSSLRPAGQSCLERRPQRGRIWSDGSRFRPLNPHQGPGGLFGVRFGTGGSACNKGNTRKKGRLGLGPPPPQPTVPSAVAALPSRLSMESRDAAPPRIQTNLCPKRKTISPKKPRGRAANGQPASKQTPDVTDGRQGTTALHIAVILGASDFVGKLVLAAAGLCVQEKGGHMALHLACREGWRDCAQQLLAPSLAIQRLSQGNRFRAQLDCTNYDEPAPMCSLLASTMISIIAHSHETPVNQQVLFSRSNFPGCFSFEGWSRNVLLENQKTSER